MPAAPSPQVVGAQGAVAVRAQQELPTAASVAVLVALPVTLLLLDSTWIYSGPHRDHWLYYGYFRSAFAYASLHPDLYYSSRMSVNLLGFLFHHLLPPLAANFALHLSLYWAAVLSFFGTAAIVFGRRPALLGAISLGVHPMFLQAVGSNYVDGFGLTYFLVALFCLALAARGHVPRVGLFLCGAFCAALVAANILYVLYLPLLAAAFLFLNRQWARRSFLHSGALAVAGGAAAMAAMGVLNRVAGGPFFFLRSSLSYAWGIGSGRIANIWRRADSAWLVDAVWLVFPVLATCGAIAVLVHARGMIGRERAMILAGQVQCVAFMLGVVLLSLDWMDLLQFPFTASILIPPACLALAGQVAYLGVGISRRAYALALGSLMLATGLRWAFHPEREDLLPWIATPVPVTVPLLVGLAGVAVVLAGARGAAAVSAFVVATALSHGLIATKFFEPSRGEQARDLFLQMVGAVTAIERADPSLRIRTWYNQQDEHGQVFDAIACSFLLCERLVNTGFPNLPDRRMCDQDLLEPGQLIAILSARPQAFAEAAQALAHVGLVAEPLRREEIPGPIPGFAVVFLRAR